MIEVQGLTKRFGNIAAVDDLSFTVQPGVVTGFLGPNGAGKSDAEKFVELLTPSGAAISVAPDGALLAAGIDAPAVGEIAARHGIRLYELSQQVASLERAFMELTHLMRKPPSTHLTWLKRSI